MTAAQKQLPNRAASVALKVKANCSTAQWKRQEMKGGGKGLCSDELLADTASALPRNFMLPHLRRPLACKQVRLVLWVPCHQPLQNYTGAG